MPPEIDIYQLPIPAWGLRCPGCNYDLTGLPAHRCPECGLAFNVADVVQTWHRLRPPTYSGGERPLPDFGLECARCEAALAGAPGSACPACGAAFDLEALRPTTEWFVVDRVHRRGIPSRLIEAMLTEAYVPYLRDEHQTYRSVYGITTLDPVRIRVHREFFFDLLHLVRAREVEYLGDIERSSPGQWRCPRCGETCPGHFDICWSCGADRL